MPASYQSFLVSRMAARSDIHRRCHTDRNCDDRDKADYACRAEMKRVVQHLRSTPTDDTDQNRLDHDNDRRNAHTGRHPH